MSHDETKCVNCVTPAEDRSDNAMPEKSMKTASSESWACSDCETLNSDLNEKCTVCERSRRVRRVKGALEGLVEYDKLRDQRPSEAFPTETCDACLEGARFGDSFVKSPHTCRKNTEYYCGHSAQDYEIRNGSLTCTECGPRSETATPPGADVYAPDADPYGPLPEGWTWQKLRRAIDDAPDDLSRERAKVAWLTAAWNGQKNATHQVQKALAREKKLRRQEADRGRPTATVAGCGDPTCQGKDCGSVVCGLPLRPGAVGVPAGALATLIDIVRAEEREACAKLCDQHAEWVSDPGRFTVEERNGAEAAARSLASAMRLRTCTREEFEDAQVRVMAEARDDGSPVVARGNEHDFARALGWCASEGVSDSVADSLSDLLAQVRAEARDGCARAILNTPCSPGSILDLCKPWLRRERATDPDEAIGLRGALNAALLELGTVIQQRNKLRDVLHKAEAHLNRTPYHEGDDAVIDAIDDALDSLTAPSSRAGEEGGGSQ